MPSRNYISPAHKGKIYIAELARAGCRKVKWHVMPEKFPPNDPIGLDVACDARSVPSALRRAGRVHLGLSGTAQP